MTKNVGTSPALSTNLFLHLLNISIDISSIQYIEWDTVGSGIRHSRTEPSVIESWTRTYIYCSGKPQPIVLTDSCPEYRADVLKLKNAIGK